MLKLLLELFLEKSDLYDKKFSFTASEAGTKPKIKF